MKRTLILLAAVVGFATAANAATLTLVSDKATYNIGETIVLTVTGDSGGPGGDAAFAIFARILYDAALTEGVSGSQVPHVIMMANASAGFAGIEFDGQAVSLNQVFGLSPQTMNASPTIGTTTLIAEAAGTVNVNYYIDSTNANTLNYFGITSQPGISFLIVPEPTTAALIGLGLVGLVLGGRRRA